MIRFKYIFPLAGAFALLQSCNSEQSSIGENANTADATLTGQIFDVSGKPASYAKVYLHGDSLVDLNALKKNNGRTSIAVVSDKEGRFLFQGDFKGKAWLEASFNDTLAVLDSVDFNAVEHPVIPDVQLRPVVELHIAVAPGQAGSSIWIPELNRLILIEDEVNVVSVLLPAGSYNIQILGNSSSDIDSAHVETGDTQVTEVVPFEDIYATSGLDTLADWNFNNAAQPGFDASRQANHAVTGEGSPVAIGGSLVLNGSSGLRVPLSSAYLRNDFVVEARIYPTSFGVMDNIITTEPPGRYGDGWLLRLDSGKIAFYLRDESTHGSTWNILKSTDTLKTNAWYTVRADRKGSITRLWVNNVLIDSAVIAGNIGQLKYDVGIGYDAMNQAFHNRFFKGKMDYIRIFANTTSASQGSDTVSQSADTAWTAAWEFTSSGNIGYDATGNGHNAAIGEGTMTVIDGKAQFNGKSGLTVKLDSAFMKPDFIVEARIRPTSFGTMDNIITAEPPGRYGDGWLLRLDSGVVVFYLRDEKTQGINWSTVGTHRLVAGEWATIRVERKGAWVRVYVNNALVNSQEVAGDCSQLKYNLGLGYDAMNQALHNRFFKGEMDYIRYRAL